MMTLDERLLVGLKMLERLRPSLRLRRSGQLAPPISRPLSLDEGELVEELTEESSPQERGSLRAPGAVVELPSLEALLEQLGETAPYSVTLGVCEDGLPFLLDLTNPAPGALLVAGDQGCGKTRLLRSVLASAVYLNNPDDVAYYLVVNDPEEYFDLAQSDHCQQLSTVNEDGLSELVMELVEMVEQRRRGKFLDSAILLAIDDLASCLEFIDEETYSRLYWLIRHGPRSRIWTLATLSAQKAAGIDPRFLSAFRTRLVGHVANRRQASTLSGDDRLDTRRLESGYEFSVPYGEEWVRFCICDPEALGDDGLEEELE